MVVCSERCVLSGTEASAKSQFLGQRSPRVCLFVCLCVCARARACFFFIVY